MATASEIKVIEAYIGLLGRAPDPEGLAYWTAQLDAAGGTTDALKKLTNDITQSAEWDAGLGSNVAADGTISEAGASNIVTQMYTNLFDRAATATDITYWGAQLQDGTVTASEMAVLLIAAAQEKGNSDAATLALKEEAAEYYSENVTQEQFNRDSAGDAVASVNSPNTVADSKAATDLIAADEGNDYVLSSTVTEAKVTFTGATDTVTGTFGTDATYSAGALEDISASDNDSLTLSGDAATLTLGTTKDIENVNISLSKAKVGGATIDMTAVTGADNTSITAAGDVTIVGVDVAGETVITLDDPKGNITTTGVTDLTVTTPSSLAQDMTFDSDMAALTNIGANAINANDTNLVFANNDVTIKLAGSAATNDSVNITVDNEAALTVSTANIEDITITAGNNDATVTLDVVEASSSAVSYTIAGSNDVTLKTSAAEITNSGFTNSGSGDVGLTLTGGDGKLTNFGVLGNGVTLGADFGFDLELASGNTVTNAAAQTGAISFDANDSATDSSITLVMGKNTTGVTFADYETVVIDTNDSTLSSTGDLDLGDASATIGGSNDVTVGALVNGDVVSIVADDLTVGAVTVSNDITLVGQNDVDITSIASTQNDVDVDAGGTVTTGAITANATTGTIDLKGDAVDVNGTLTSTKGSVVVEATGNDIDLQVITVQNDVTLKGVDAIDVIGTITSSSGSVSIETTGVLGSNDITVDSVVAQNDISIDGGNDVTASGAITVDDAGSVTIVAGNEITLEAAATVTSEDDLTLTAGSAITTVATPDLVAANDIVITAGNDIDMNAAADTDITATAGDITISGDKIEINGELTATEGTVTLTGNDTDASLITLVTAKNMTVNDGDITVTTTTLTDTLAIQGDGDFTSTTVTAPVVALSTTNDVDITTLISELVVGGAAGDYDLGVISNGTGADTDAISVTTNAGDDSMELDDRAVGGSTADSVYTVATGEGADTVTITDVAAGSIVNTGAGADVVSVGATQTASVTLVTGDGDDTLTLATGAVGSFSLGNDTNTLDVTGGADLTGATVTGINNLVVDGGATITVDQAFLSNDSEFNISGGNATIAATGLTSADMSNVTYAGGNTTSVNLTAGGTGSTLVGTSNADTLTGGAGVDVITGGAGIDTIDGAAGSDTINLGADAAVDIVKISQITGTDTVNGFATAANDDTLQVSGITGISGVGIAVAANATLAFAAGKTNVHADGSDGGAAEAIADYTDLTDVAAYLEATITGDNTGKQVNIINDLVNDKAYIYYVDSSDLTVDAADIVLIGVINVDNAAMVAAQVIA